MRSHLFKVPELGRQKWMWLLNDRPAFDVLDKGVVKALIGGLAVAGSLEEPTRIAVIEDESETAQTFLLSFSSLPLTLVSISATPLREERWQEVVDHYRETPIIRFPAPPIARSNTDEHSSAPMNTHQHS